MGKRHNQQVYLAKIDGEYEIVHSDHVLLREERRLPPALPGDGTLTENDLLPDGGLPSIGSSGMKQVYPPSE